MDKITKTEITTNAEGQKILNKTVERVVTNNKPFLLRQKAYHQEQLALIDADLAEFDKP